MNLFEGLSLGQLERTYVGNEDLLVRDLMFCGLLKKGAPECHGPMVYRGRWMWRCTTKSCRKEVSVVTEDSFLFKKNKPYAVFKLLFMWANEYSMKQMEAESGLKGDTIRKHLMEWREMLIPGPTIT
jgi:hypothetical protein